MNRMVFPFFLELSLPVPEVVFLLNSAEKLFPELCKVQTTVGIQTPYDVLESGLKKIRLSRRQRNELSVVKKRFRQMNPSRSLCEWLKVRSKRKENARNENCVKSRRQLASKLATMCWNPVQGNYAVEKSKEQTQCCKKAVSSDESSQAFV